MADCSPSKIPTPISNKLSTDLRRSSSVRVRGERPLILYSTSTSPFPAIFEKDDEMKENDFGELAKPCGSTGLFGRSRSQASGLNIRRRDEDLESLDSFGSNVSFMSRASNCEHSPFAKNGTTFSGRSNKYVVHCSNYSPTPEQYLTPTQRANRKINKLKTLLQLAKEKLMEKENEILKLTKEVIELRVFKATYKNEDDFSEANTPSSSSEGPNDGPNTATYSKDGPDYPCDTFADLSPIKTSYCFESKSEKPEMTKSTAQNGISPREKMSATPDYLLSSLADSGNFDDLASMSVTSKDSLLFPATPEPRRHEEYENLLHDRRLELENALVALKSSHEEETIKLVDAFEKKLKDEERKFEEKYRDLVATCEKEKITIVERFTAKLDEEKKLSQTAQDLTDDYLKKLEDEKALYEKSLSEIKANFEKESFTIERAFDDAMIAERKRFEECIAEIERRCQMQVNEVNTKMANIELKYNILLKTHEGSEQEIGQLKEENANLEGLLKEQELRQKEMYLKMYLKGQEAVSFQRDNVVDDYDDGVETARNVPLKKHTEVPAPELLVKLKVTETELENLKDKEYRAAHSATTQGLSLISAKEALALWMLAARKAMYKRLYETQQQQKQLQQRDKQKLVNGASAFVRGEDVNDPEVTLQFLKSAVYYFLTDRDNHLEHLRAIESILGFSQAEKENISTHYF